MPAYDWSQFHARINVAASVKEVYEAWTTRFGLERWFLRVAEFTGPSGVIRTQREAIQKQDAYRFLWHGYDDNTVERGTVLDSNGRDRLQFTFADKCVVSISMEPREGETLVELKQLNIPLDEDSRARYHLGCLTGWTFYMANLKSVLEGGVDLRNKNERLRGVINA